MDFQALSIEELVQECARNPTSEVWEEFDRRFRRLIARTILRVCREFAERSTEAVPDLIQDTYTKLLGNQCFILRQFKARHDNSFLGFIQAVAASTAYDHFRARRAQKRWVVTVELDEAFHVAGPRSSTAPETIIFCGEIDALIAQHCDGPDGPRDQLIFRLRYHLDMTAKEISEFPGIGLGVKGVESVIFRLTQFLRRSLIAV